MNLENLCIKVLAMEEAMNKAVNYKVANQIFFDLELIRSEQVDTLGLKNIIKSYRDSMELDKSLACRVREAADRILISYTSLTLKK